MKVKVWSCVKESNAPFVRSKKVCLEYHYYYLFRRESGEAEVRPRSYMRLVSRCLALNVVNLGCCYEVSKVREKCDVIRPQAAGAKQRRNPNFHNNTLILNISTEFLETLPIMKFGFGIPKKHEHCLPMVPITQLVPH